MKILVPVVPGIPGAFALIAQTAEPISGGAGWVGAGLLGAVLAWLLLKHLPAKDAQIEKLIKDKDDQVRGLIQAKDDQFAALTAAHGAQLAAMQDVFLKEQSAVRVEHNQARDELVGMLTATFAHFRSAVHEVRDASSTAVNRAAEAVAVVTQSQGGPK